MTANHIVQSGSLEIASAVPVEAESSFLLPFQNPGFERAKRPPPWRSRLLGALSAALLITFAVLATLLTVGIASVAHRQELPPDTQVGDDVPGESRLAW